MKIIYTIGHSTRKLEEFIELLKNFKIEVLIDIRHFPHSKHNPQFNKEILEKESPKEGIDYLWLEELGGFRKGGYLAYTETQDFKEGLRKLTKITEEKVTNFRNQITKILGIHCNFRF